MGTCLPPQGAAGWTHIAAVCARLSMPVPMTLPSGLLCPCSNGYPWSFSKCDFDDFSGYADAADAVLLQRGVDINKYKYK